MMREYDVEMAMMAALNDLGFVFAWPNQDPNIAPNSPPYVDVAVQRVSRTDATLGGDLTISRYIVSASAVTLAGAYADASGQQVSGIRAAADMAQTVADAFPVALRIPVAAGTADAAWITIIKPADIQTGYRDGTNWRVPVLLTLDAS